MPRFVLPSVAEEAMAYYILIVKKDDLYKFPSGPRKLFEEHCLESNVLGHPCLVGTLVRSNMYARNGLAFPKKSGQIPWGPADLVGYSSGLGQQTVHEWVKSEMNKSVFTAQIGDPMLVLSKP